MRSKIPNVNEADILGNNDLPSSRENILAMLSRWNRKISYFTMFATPALLATHVQDARAENAVKPEVKIDELKLLRLEKRSKNCSSRPELLRRSTNYSIPHRKGEVDIINEFTGGDNCPGFPIPSGTYTAAAPYVDTGNTAGANNTIENSGCYGFQGYYSQANGPDHIYSFTLAALGPDPQIQVTGSYVQPYIYILNGSTARMCPVGTNNSANNCVADSSWPGPVSGGDVTINAASSLPLNVPLHLIVDAAGGSSGPYTLRIQDATIVPAVIPPPKTAVDFDGDSKADISVFRASDRYWYWNGSGTGFFGTQFGLATDKLAPSDYDGDGRTDLAVYRPSTGTWYILNSSNGTVSNYVFGLSDDLPTPADFDGDRKADISIFRPSTGAWYRRNSLNGQFAGMHWGQTGDIPVAGDFNDWVGDGKADFAVFRPSNGYWYLFRTQSFSTPWQAIAFGQNGDIPLSGDFDGDARSDLAVFRPSNGTWYIARRYATIPAQEFDAIPFGLSTDIPVPADYDGDGKTDIAVYRDGVWYLRQSRDGLAVKRFGLANDKPIPSVFMQ